MRPTIDEIEEIAENLDCGLKCFYNIKTREIKTIINFDSWIGADEEMWQDELKEIESNYDNFFEFQGFETHDSFQIMADFAENINNQELQLKLINALNRPKPFRNFKLHIDNSGKYRQKWFDFKKMRYVQWVKEQINHNENIFNE